MSSAKAEARIGELSMSREHSPFGPCSRLLDMLHFKPSPRVGFDTRAFFFGDETLGMVRASACAGHNTGVLVRRFRSAEARCATVSRHSKNSKISRKYFEQTFPTTPCSALAAFHTLDRYSIPTSHDLDLFRSFARQSRVYSGSCTI